MLSGTSFASKALIQRNITDLPGTRSFPHRQGLVIGGLELFDVLLAFGEQNFLLVDGILVRSLRNRTSKGTFGSTGTSTTRPLTVGMIGVVVK